MVGATGRAGPAGGADALDVAGVALDADARATGSAACGTAVTAGTAGAPAARAPSADAGDADTVGRLHVPGTTRSARSATGTAVVAAAIGAVPDVGVIGALPVVVVTTGRAGPAGGVDARAVAEVEGVAVGADATATGSAARGPAVTGVAETAGSPADRGPSVDTGDVDTVGRLHVAGTTRSARSTTGTAVVAGGVGARVVGVPDTTSTGAVGAVRAVPRADAAGSATVVDADPVGEAATCGRAEAPVVRADVVDTEVADIAGGMTVEPRCTSRAADVDDAAPACGGCGASPTAGTTNRDEVVAAAGDEVTDAGKTLGIPDADGSAARFTDAGTVRTVGTVEETGDDADTIGGFGATSTAGSTAGAEIDDVGRSAVAGTRTVVDPPVAGDAEAAVSGPAAIGRAAAAGVVVAGTIGGVEGIVNDSAAVRGAESATSGTAGAERDGGAAVCEAVDTGTVTGNAAV